MGTLKRQAAKSGLTSLALALSGGLLLAACGSPVTPAYRGYDRAGLETSKAVSGAVRDSADSHSPVFSRPVAGR